MPCVRAVLLACGMFLSCGVVEQRPTGVATGKGEAIDPNNDPDLLALDEPLERSLDRLPPSGEAASIPWPGYHWPVSLDGINFRWDGENSLSPIEKYEKAFKRTGVVDNYHYVLEVNQGMIVGGEYVGDSKKNHPDLLWRPTSGPPEEFLGIRYEDVSTLLGASGRQGVRP